MSPTLALLVQREAEISAFVPSIYYTVQLDLGGFQAVSEKYDQHFLPEMADGQSLSVQSASVKQGKTTPPKHFTEDTLLSAMETAGAKDMPSDAERKCLGTPATRAGILEKLVSAGLASRKKSKKVTSLLPTALGRALITVLPEQLQSPQLTAEWEHRLKQIEHGEAPKGFLDDIGTMLKTLIETYEPAPGADVLFPSRRQIVGNARAAARTWWNGKRAIPVRIVPAAFPCGRTAFSLPPNGYRLHRSSRPRCFGTAGRRFTAAILRKSARPMMPMPFSRPTERKRAFGSSFRKRRARRNDVDYRWRRCFYRRGGSAGTSSFID